MYPDGADRTATHPVRPTRGPGYCATRESPAPYESDKEMSDATRVGDPALQLATFHIRLTVWCSERRARLLLPSRGPAWSSWAAAGTGWAGETGHRHALGCSLR